VRFICHCARWNCHSNELSRFNKLHESKLCSRSRTCEQYLVSVYCGHSLTTQNIFMWICNWVLMHVIRGIWRQTYASTHQSITCRTAKGHRRKHEKLIVTNSCWFLSGGYFITYIYMFICIYKIRSVDSANRQALMSISRKKLSSSCAVLTSLGKKGKFIPVTGHGIP
jgi:hypothetical protein